MEAVTEKVTETLKLTKLDLDHKLRLLGVKMFQNRHMKKLHNLITL